MLINNNEMFISQDSSPFYSSECFFVKWDNPMFQHSIVPVIIESKQILLLTEKRSFRKMMPVKEMKVGQGKKEME